MTPYDSKIGLRYPCAILISKSKSITLIADMNKKLQLDIKHKDDLAKVSHALSNPSRLDILALLSKESLSVDEIAKRLKSPLTSVASNIQILENAGLLRAKLQAGKHGTMKLCSLVYENIDIDFMSAIESEIQKKKTIEIPIGSYFSVDVKPTCGLASEKGYIGKDDDENTFYLPERVNAQLLWFREGYIEYLIPIENKENISSISLSFEACSEAPNYRNIFPSDITLVLNDIEVGTWKCPGDFGGRRGKVSPSWWPINSSQFGLWKTWNVSGKGTFIDYEKLSDVTPKMLFHDERKALSIKIMVKHDAQNVGGINLFGAKFGDIPSGILLTYCYND